MDMVVSKKVTEVFTCGYCNKEYKRECSLINHLCEKKKRAIMRDTKEAKVALDVWLRFRKVAKMPYKKTLLPYEAFSESKEFTAFVTFAKYLIESQIIEPEEFVNELLRDSIPMRDWSTQKVKTAWIHRTLRREDPDRAIARSIERISQWATETENDIKNFFKDVSTQRAVLLIETGKISPWFVYAASTREFLLSRLSDDEFMYIYEFINPAVWNAKKIKYSTEFDHYQDVLKEFGL